MALNEADVRQYYEAILQREPTDAQLAVAMATGTADSLINALIGSNEAQSFVFPLLQVYQAVFGRVPDAAGLDFWVDQYRAGVSLETITEGFVASDEFQTKYGGVTDGSDPAFINELYRNVLGRDGDPAGIAFWTAQTGISPAEVVRLFAIDTEFTNKAAAPIAQFLTDAANGTQDYLGDLFEGFNSPDQTFSLTTGTDNLPGTAGNDLFIAGEVGGVAALTVGDTINGGAGNDTLDWVQTAAINGLPTGVSVSNVETVNVTSGGAITLNTTSGFTGTTALNTNTSGAAQTITAAATTDVTVNAAAQAANNVAVNGGNNVTVNATGTTTGTTTVGATAAAAGDVVVNVTNSTGGTITGNIGVTGGKTVTVTSAAANAVNTTVTQSAVTVTGNASTTDVTVNQDATVAAAATVVGKTAGTVTINDVNAASATAAGTIATVTLNSYGNSSIDSSALTTVNLSGTGGTLGIGRGALAATPTENTLNLNVSGLTAGAITDTEAGADADDGFTTINLDSSGTASTIADLIAADATVLNISGDAKVTLTAQTLANTKTITVTNTAGASLGTALANDVVFTGGAGDDAISIGATTKAINMGAGDDVVTLSSASLGAGGTLNGGDGRDTLVANTNGSSFIADPAFGGFEVLRVAGASAQGSHNANGFAELEIGATAGATTFTNVAAGVGLTVLAAPTGGATVALANATGTADVFNLSLESGANLAAGSVTLAGIETVNITNTDTLTTPASGINTNSLTLVATSATSVVVTGNAGLNLTNVGNTAITSFDASGITGAATDAAALAVTFTSANSTIGELITITGGSGNDVLTGGTLTNDTINGGAGNDTLVYTGGVDFFTGGAGNDIFAVNATGTKTAFLTINDATAADMINFTSLLGTPANVDYAAGTGAGSFGAQKVTLGAGATLDQYLDAAAAGDGATADEIISWFNFDGNTYLVVDNTAGASFDTTDTLVKLVGVHDLTNSAVVDGVLTIA